jgi:transposase InsO family protein
MKMAMGQGLVYAESNKIQEVFTMSTSHDLYEMAHFRFSLIAPVLQGTHTDESDIAYFRRVTANPLRRPDGTEHKYEAKTLKTWTERYRSGGMDALITAPRSDAGVTRGLSNDAMDAIHSLRERFPRLNATQIHLRLLEEGRITAGASVRCVQRFIKRWQLQTGECAGLKDRRAFEEAYFGGMWQADSCHFPYIPDEKGRPAKTYLIAIVDDYSRMIVGARLFWNDNAVNFQKVLKGAVAAYGISNKTYCDNGGPYVNDQTKLICGNIGTVLLHAPVRDGASKGKVERTFRTIKERWLNGIDKGSIRSLEDFNLLLAAYVREHNLTVNASTGETPMDRFLATRDRIKMPKSREWLDECFMHRISRKVRKDSTLRIDKRQFDVPMQFIGQTADVRYLPDEDGSAYIMFDGKHFPLRKTNKAENGRTRRKTATIDYSRASGGDDNV